MYKKYDVHECVRHSPELYCSQLTYSGVTLSLGWLDSTVGADGRRLRRLGRPAGRNTQAACDTRPGAVP